MTHLTKAEIDDILRLLDTSDFQELKLELGDLKLEVRRKGASSAAPSVATAPTAAAQAPATMTTATMTMAAPIVAASGDGVEVPAPLLGTFYHAPRPGADPFIKPGDTVGPDTVIGIIEVMKLMNSVTAGLAGVVTEILVPNGALVEHGQALIRVRPL